MSEDAALETPSEAAAETPEYSEVELQAINDGWNPNQEEVEASGKKWVPADVFNEKGSFFKKINDQKKQIDNLQSSIEKLNEHNRKVAERERQQIVEKYESTIAKLKAEKIEALDEADHARVVEIDEQIRKTEAPPAIDDGFASALESFKSENKWYDNNSEMQDYADVMGLGYSNKHPNASPEQIFDYIVKETKARFPGEFENGKRNAPPSVEGDTPTRATPKSVGVNDLRPDELKIFKDFERQKVFKTDAERKDYIKEVISLRD